MTDEIQETPGPTGNFPDGKIHPTDAGELRIGIAKRNGLVILHFGAPMEWIGFSPAEGRIFAEKILKTCEGM